MENKTNLPEDVSCRHSQCSLSKSRARFTFSLYLPNSSGVLPLQLDASVNHPDRPESHPESRPVPIIPDPLR
ncbi:hypothetical protein CEXT_362511 [Caerostris extrusa]|uniref:Uncharacterized protein n=1 Tax=Caerostris extrusa TaxID=172846 RepID=A0AAV4RH40_CAEEX|nr:hypothetical protein CEXT_362511 [Caerostris extrusa]